MTAPTLRAVYGFVPGSSSDPDTNRIKTRARIERKLADALADDTGLTRYQAADMADAMITAFVNVGNERLWGILEAAHQVAADDLAAFRLSCLSNLSNLSGLRTPGGGT